MANLRPVYDLQGCLDDQYCGVVDEPLPRDTLFRLRMAKGFRFKKDFAKFAGVDRETYGKAESGEKVADETKRRIARAHELPVEAIWPPNVSSAIHRTAQIDTNRAKVPSVPAENPAPSDYADPRKADVSEGEMVRALTQIVREYGLTNAQTLQWIIKAGVLAASIASTQEGLSRPPRQSHGP